MSLQTTELEREIAELTQSNITISSQLSTATLRYNSMSTNLNKELEELQVCAYSVIVHIQTGTGTSS